MQEWQGVKVIPDRLKIRRIAECSGDRAVLDDSPAIGGSPGKKSRDRQPLDLGTMHTCGEFNKKPHIALRSRTTAQSGEFRRKAGRNTAVLLLSLFPVYLSIHQTPYEILDEIYCSYIISYDL